MRGRSGTLGWMLLLGGLCLAGPPDRHPEARLQDFDQAAAFVKARYAWPERIDLQGLVRHFRPLMTKPMGDPAFQRLLEAFLDGLGDAHSHLGSNGPDSWCLPPGQVAAQWQDGKARVLALWPGSGAERAGLRPGMEILAWNGQPLEEALRARAPHLSEPLHEDQAHWRLNALLAGRHNQGCTLRVRDGDTVREIPIPAGDPPDPPLPEPRLLDGQIGLIALRELGSPLQVSRLDGALARFPEARGWILDLRGLRAGGDTGVTLPIMGRFLERTRTYAWMQRRRGAALGEPMPQQVRPRGKAFRGPLVILVDPWTASAAEGLAMGLSGLGRAKVVGTRMAGLGAAVHSLTLRHSRLRVQISTEPVLDRGRRPRNAFRPDLPVDLGLPGDPILEVGLKEMRRLLEP